MEQQGTQTPEAPVSSRETLSAVIDQLEEKDNSNGSQSGTGDAAVPQKVEAGEGIIKSPVQPAAGEAQVKPADGQQAKPAASLTDTPARGQTIKAPVSWKPDVREKWATLPPEVQAEVARREREIQTTLQETAAHRQLVDRMQTTIQPYQQLIMLEGGDPMKSFQDYLRTATMLRMGTAGEKATAIAQAIRTFGVDVQALDTALAAVLQGQPVPNMPNNQPQQFRDPRVDELLQTMQQREQQESLQTEAELSAEIAEFAAKPEFEFFEDLRGDIGLLLNAAVQQRRVMSLAQAYNYAASMHPEISKVIQQRAAAETAKANAKNIAAKKLAGGSIYSGAPAQTGQVNGEKLTTRSAIEAAIEQLGA